MPMVAQTVDSLGRVLRPGEDPHEPIECICTALYKAKPEDEPSPVRHRFEMADPGSPNNQRVMRYDVTTGERFPVPRGYTIPMVSDGDGNSAVPSILESLAPGCVPVTHPRAVAFLASEAGRRAVAALEKAQQPKATK